MKIVVIGGTGLIGSKLVDKLRLSDHEIVAASPSSGVNTITGDGLAKALTNAQVVIDVSNAPSFDDQAVMNFFVLSGHNLLRAAKAAGVKHHIALSVVGTERLQKSGYFRAKQRQENLVKESGLPYTILHSTQFFEFAGSIVNFGMTADEVHVSSAAIQPIASIEVATALADIAEQAPINATVEVAGPERMPMNEFIRYYLTSTDDPRQLVTDAQALYYGALLSNETLVPGEQARLGKIKYEDWCMMQYDRVMS